MDDVWSKYAPIIKQLYQDERKTLKEIKAILETKHGFPKTPISVYETRLRDAQGLRKKLKAKDWPQIYRYSRARGLDRFDLYLNGTLIPWKKVWKEIRRSGVTKARDHGADQDATLPEGIELRKPSHNGAHRTCHRDTVSQPGICPLSKSTGSQIMLAPSREPSPDNHRPTLPLAHSYTEPLELHKTAQVMCADESFSYMIADWALESLPWNEYRLELRCEITQYSCLVPRLTGNPVLHAVNGMGSMELGLHQLDYLIPAVASLFDVLRQLNRGSQGPSLKSHAQNLTPATPRQGPLSTNFGKDHITILFVYVCSNRLRPYRDTSDLFENMSHSLPRQSRLDLFKSDSLSIHACWEALFDEALKLRINGMLMLLLTAALRHHPEWIDQELSQRLFAAVLTRDTSLVQQLVERGALPTFVADEQLMNNSSQSRTPLGVAAEYGMLDCAKLLVEACDPNMPARKRSDLQNTQSIFAEFLDDFDRKLDWQPNADLSDYSAVLGELLEAGANVDYVYSRSIDEYVDDGEQNADNNGDAIPLGWGTTCLDTWFYVCRPMFDQMVPYSLAWRTELTKSGIAMAASNGEHVLADYIRLRSPPRGSTADQYLEMALSEQFSFIYQATDEEPLNLSSRITKAMVGCGVRIQANVHNWDGKTICPLHAVVTAAARIGLDESLKHLLQLLVMNGASITEPVLTSSIAETGTEVLEALREYNGGTLTGLGGATTLFKAAEKFNYDALSWLLKECVDVNDMMTTPRGPVTIIARLMDVGSRQRRTYVSSNGHVGQLLKMWQFLVRNGAKLRLQTGQDTCFELLYELIGNSGSDIQDWWIFWELFNFIMQSDDSSDRVSSCQWMELLMRLPYRCPTCTCTSAEETYKLKLFHALLEQCQSPLSQPVLSLAIAMGCEESFIYGLIDSGQSIHEYSNGTTPLQATAKRCNPCLAAFLLGRNVDVNALSREENGGTALQLACGLDLKDEVGRMRQLELIRLFIVHGADVNAIPHGAAGSTALQLVCRDYFDHSDQSHEQWHMDSFLLLLDNGADVNIEPGILTRTALQRSAANGYLKMARCLIQQGADANGYPFIEDASGGIRALSALDLAAQFGRLDMTQYLLSVGALSARPGATGFQGALDAATKARHSTVAEVIRKHADKVGERLSQDLDMLVAHLRCVDQHEVAADKRRTQYKHWRLERGFTDESGENPGDEYVGQLGKAQTEAKR